MEMFKGAVTESIGIREPGTEIQLLSDLMSQIYLKGCAIKKMHLCDISKSECNKITSIRQADASD